MESEHEPLEVYQIIIKGHLDSEWSEWFEGLTITMADNGATILSSRLADQTALHGVLIKIRDLGLPLLSLTRIDPDLSERFPGHLSHNRRNIRSSRSCTYPTLSCIEEVVEIRTRTCADRSHRMSE